jgi:hypothetical protein
MIPARAALPWVSSWPLFSRHPPLDGENGPVCDVRRPGQEVNDVFAGVKRIGRAAHRFDGKSEPVALSDHVVGGVDLDPVARPIPADSDTGSAGLREPNRCIPLRIPDETGEWMIDLDAAQCPCLAEVKRPVSSRAPAQGQKPVGGDLQECVGRQLEAPGIEC